MDYGTMLKKHVGNLSRQSSHYAKQSKFEGSDRQVRGQILGLLLQEHSVLQEEVYKILNKDMQRVNKIIFDLCFEGYIKREGTMLALNNNN
jgi:A/G-specific adenine glycosylase